MGRSYLGCQKNIYTGQIMLFCSHGEMFSRLLGKVSRCDVNFVKCKQKVFPLSRKVEFIWHKIISVTEISSVSKRDLGTWENFSSHMNAMKLFILFHNKARSHLQTCRNVFSVTEITYGHMNRPFKWQFSDCEMNQLYLWHSFPMHEPKDESVL